MNDINEDILGDDPEENGNNLDGDTEIIGMVSKKLRKNQIYGMMFETSEGIHKVCSPCVQGANIPDEIYLGQSVRGIQVDGSRNVKGTVWGLLDPDKNVRFIGVQFEDVNDKSIRWLRHTELKFDGNE